MPLALFFASDLDVESAAGIDASVGKSDEFDVFEIEETLAIGSAATPTGL